MGKRTKFQRTCLPQFTLNVIKEPNAQFSEYYEENENEKHDADLPKDIKLDDEVRLDKIKFVEHRELVTLCESEQCLIFALYNLAKRSKPKDALMNEGLLPYLESVLNATRQTWSLRTNALLERSKLERDNRRTVERSLMQVECLVESLKLRSQAGGLNICASNHNNRMRCIYASQLPPFWQIETELVRLYQSLGSTKSALDVALRLELWEDVIACYHQLNLRHKAAEVIQSKMDKEGDTPLLLCMLGDATDDEGCYHKALKLSSDKSSRAYRSLGLRYIALS